MQMGLVAGRDLQSAGLDLDEALRGKVASQRGNDPIACQQERPAVGMDVRGPEWRSGGGIGRRLRHNLVYENPRKLLAIRLRMGMVRPELPHVPEKWEPVFRTRTCATSNACPQGVGTDFPTRVMHKL